MGDLPCPHPRLRWSRALKGANNLLGRHHIGKQRTHVVQSGIVLSVAERGIRVTHKNYLVVELHGIPSGGLTTAVSQCSTHDERVDVTLAQNPVQIAGSGNEGAKAALVDL